MVKTKIGILLVHGIGNQHQFEHLDEVARSFLKMLMPKYTVHVDVTTGSMGEFGSRKEVWLKGKRGTITATVKDRTSTQEYELHFREVWWADLGEPTTLKTVLQFWWWGTSLWMDSFHREHIYQDDIRTSLPKDSKQNFPYINWQVRWELFVTCIMITGVMPALAFVKKVLESIGINVSLDIISQYVSKVKLFQQERRETKEPINYLGEPPRTTIRRRMVNELIEMASGGYDRWYILSHSLGSVVAYNGLFETEQMLPRYLNKKLWHRACRHGLNKTLASNDRLCDESNILIPNRPDWLLDSDAIDRRKLFSNLEGFLTYGSPLKKYAILWPWLVRENRGNSNDNVGIFSNSFEWVNIYDPLDPVSSTTDFFNKNDLLLNPVEYAYSLDGFHLDCHLKYLKPGEKSIVNVIANWMLSNTRFIDTASNFNINFLDSKRQIIRHRKRSCRNFLIFLSLPIILGFLSTLLSTIIGVFNYILHVGSYINIFELFNPLEEFTFYFIIYLFIIPLIVIGSGLYKYYKNYKYESNVQKAKQDIQLFLHLQFKTNIKSRDKIYSIQDQMTNSYSEAVSFDILIKKLNYRKCTLVKAGIELAKQNRYLLFLELNKLNNINFNKSSLTNLESKTINILEKCVQQKKGLISIDDVKERLKNEIVEISSDKGNKFVEDKFIQIIQKLYLTNKIDIAISNTQAFD